MVAPRVGAWIETNIYRKKRGIIPSHPVWVRGLKLSIDVIQNSVDMSHPVWVRGLKQSMIKKMESKEYVAPRVGAWIETSYFRNHHVPP